MRSGSTTSFTCVLHSMERETAWYRLWVLDVYSREAWVCSIAWISILWDLCK